MARPMAMMVATMPSMRSVLLSLAGLRLPAGSLGDGDVGGHPAGHRGAGPRAIEGALAPIKSLFPVAYPSSTRTTGRRTAAGGPPFPPTEATNAASISGQIMSSGLALQRATMPSSQAVPNAPKNGT